MWDLLHNEDEMMIVDAARDFLASELPIERLRPNGLPVDNAAVLKRMGELGWLALGLPEEAGGSALGIVEEVLIQRECGRHLASPSVLATVLAAHVALAAKDVSLTRALASGEASAATALVTAAGEVDCRDALVFDWLPDLPIVAWKDGALGLFEPQAFVDCLPEQCVDDSVTLHVGRIRSTGTSPLSAEYVARLAARAQVLLAAALTGLAERACEITVEYAKVREQFGKSIGTFQAVKHRCADMAVRSRLAWHQTCLAALHLQAGHGDAAFQVASAKLVAGKAAHENARAAIQLHGGIGYQAECDVHWFMKRAHLYGQLGGDEREQARRITRDLVIAREAASYREMA